MDVLSSGSSNSAANAPQDQISAHEVHLPSTSTKISFCWFYSTYGRCKFGRNCNYSHNKPIKTGESKESRKKYDYKGRNLKLSRNGKIDSKSSSEGLIVCRFIKASSCRTTDHPALSELSNSDPLSQSITFSYRDLDEEHIQEEVDVVTCKATNKQRENELPVNFPQNGILPSLSQSHIIVPEDCNDLRETEIQLFKKRYPQHTLTQEDDKDSYEITFSSTDPDWAFSVKFIQLVITLKNTYPKEICDIQVLDRNGEIPPLLVRYLNSSMKQWLQERHKSNLSAGKFELVLRPFFKWLDRQLEQLFIDGLKKVKLHVEAERAGIECIPYELLAETLTNASSPKKEESKCAASDQTESNTNMEASPVDQTIIENSSNLYSTKQDTSLILPPQNSPKCNQKSDINEAKHTVKRGTEIKLLGLELTEGSASFECKKISISVICMRCKTPTEMVTSLKQCQTTSCLKCNKTLQITFQSSLVHQHSNVLGYVHLSDCQALDLPLPQCRFFIDCLNCNKRNDVDGIHFGKMLTTWCLFCNQKLCLIVQACKFQQLQPPARAGKLSTLPSEKKQKNSRDVIIELGKPLPMYGTCKHYKKSHRWLRFPCCGKVYPCDICHDEIDAGHEMKRASRMICGYCSKEQPYSLDKPCTACSSSLTKKSGKHWEGGKGCRDKISMSRADTHKYSGGSKTVSRKAIEHKPKKKS